MYVNNGLNDCNVKGVIDIDNPHGDLSPNSAVPLSRVARFSLVGSLFWFLHAATDPVSQPLLQQPVNLVNIMKNLAKDAFFSPSGADGVQKDFRETEYC